MFRYVTETIVKKAPFNRRIAVLSDLHNSVNWSNIKLPDVDVILCPGDMVESYGYGWNNTLDFFRYLVGIAPVFYSVGNHECLSPKEYFDTVRDIGVTVLNNEAIEHDGFVIGGIQDWYDHLSIPVLDELEKGTKYKILLSHRPELYDRYIKDRDIDLIVSGHGHGGQIRLFNHGIFAPDQGFLPKYTDGLYDNRFLVSAGLENTRKWIPRLGNPYKVYIVELREDV